MAKVAGLCHFSYFLNPLYLLYSTLSALSQSIPIYLLYPNLSQSIYSIPIYLLYLIYFLYPYHQQTYIPFPDKSTLRFIPIDIASIHYG